MFYVYSLRCANQSYYTGISTNVPERLNAANEDRGPAATRGHGPVTLAFTVGPFPDRASANIVLQRILPEISGRYTALLRGEQEIVSRFGVEVKMGTQALEAALALPPAHYTTLRHAQARTRSSSSSSDLAGVSLDLALSDPAELARFLLDFVGPRDGDIILRRLVTNESLVSVGARHGRSRERVRQIMAKFGMRVRRAFRSSRLGMLLLEECQAAVGEGHEPGVSPWVLGSVMARTLGWKPSRGQLALLLGMLGEVDSSLQLDEKLRLSPAEVGVASHRRSGNGAPDGLEHDLAIQLIRQLGAGPDTPVDQGES